MATSTKPPREWDVHDLFDLGRQSRGTYLKAVPVLILETWMEGEREEGVANFVRTGNLADRLVRSGLVTPFKPKGTSNLGAALGKIQSGRNLTRPPLITSEGLGLYWINLPYYEALLWEYYQEYRQRYKQDYAKLFPEGAPAWEHLRLRQAPLKREKDTPVTSGVELHDEILGLVAPMERALRDRDQAVERLTDENRRLLAKLVALQRPGRILADEELRDDCQEFLKREDTCIDAIRRAGVVLEERLKKTIGGKGPERFKQGVDLVDYALAKEKGKLIISEHPAEQEGVHLLFRGAIQFVRNPPSHKKLRYTVLEARQAVSLIDYLLALLKQVRLRDG